MPAAVARFLTELTFGYYYSHFTEAMCTLLQLFWVLHLQRDVREGSWPPLPFPWSDQGGVAVAYALPGVQKGWGFILEQKITG